MIDPRPLIHLMDGEQDASEVGVRLDRMIRAGLDPNWVDPEQDRSILEIALANARWEAALRLIQAGARVRDTDSESWNVLEMAGVSGPRRMIEALLEVGASWESLVFEHEGYDFPVECNEPYMDRRSYLVTRCDLIPDLVERKDFARLDWLWTVGAGVLLDVFDDLHWTPLTHSVNNGDIEGAAWLISKGAWVNPVSAFDLSLTPLDRAVMDRQIEMVRLLLSAGANPSIPTWTHATAMERALQNRAAASDEATAAIDEEIVTLLKRACKDFDPPRWPNGASPARWPPSECIPMEEKAN